MSAVYKAINTIQGELAKTGISKDGQNTQQNYRFRGIDQVYAALAPLLAKHGLCIIPRITEREMRERVTIKEWNGQKKESVLFFVTVAAEFDFVAAEDGSVHTVRTYGEAMDSADKATNKAMSAAYKYAAFMTFAIPTEGDNDADATTHEIEPVKQGVAEAAVEKIDEAQWTKITSLLEATSSDVKKFCTFYKCKSVREMSPEAYARAVVVLEKKLEGMTPKTTDDLDEDAIPY